MSQWFTTSSASCGNAFGSTRFAAALCALALLGCTGPGASKKPSPNADADLPPQADFHSRRSDDGRWLVDVLLREWRSPVLPSELLRELDKETGSDRSIEEALLASLPSAGLWTFAMYGTWEDLARRVDARVPVVVQLASASGRRRIRSFAVIRSLSKEKDFVVGEVAGRKPFRLGGAEFRRRWHLYRNWMLVACPPEKVAWPLSASERLSWIRYHDAIGREQVADDLVREWLAEGLKNPDVLSVLGSRSIARGNAQEAEQLLRRSLELDAQQPRAANNLAFLLAHERRNLDDALKLAKRALESEPSNPRFLHTLGFVYARREDWPNAVRALEQAWQRSGLLPLEARKEVGLCLMRAYLQLDRTDEARTIAASLCTADPNIGWPPELQRQLDLPSNCH
ncbi:MAG: tetratricopeptide repeat protein [Kiritimatiellae bacterium]|nr:tetratricopeptide repeat protein [Kiritimatiellia bacterium]MDW8458287.1 tetratricopeptide repeat protein [Verrucomicrobiota bacterium]